MTDKKTVLIVEDDPFIAMDLEDIFQAHGYDVIGPVADVDTGFKLLEGQTPNFAMLDYNLGRETSIPLAKALHADSVPFVFLSGQVERVIIDIDLPTKRVIAKPFIPEQLLKIVDDHLV
ncbi:response regulator [Litorimonas sp. RW-G-Af-16]|uniref:response regulator n=1 Tax=Litorimonas sp. RW-G-Af-16 TaxID=3241168 RepID=UPI00390C7CD7